jgi:mono/diheme cytochrome c family protein
MGLLAAALFALGTGTTANAQQSATPSSKGEYLARAGDCIACHSVRGGKAFAGGLRMGTPMGTIYSTNITPDPDTGIGNYSLQDFDRAVRSGVAKDGHHLYPAMPYPSFAKISDDDLGALYTFFMKEVPPIKQANKDNEIPWYLSGVGRWRSGMRSLRRIVPMWPKRIMTPVGIAAPIWSKGWAIAVPAIRRAVGRSRKGPTTTAAAPICKARSSIPRQICAGTCAPVSVDGRRTISRGS